MYRNREGLCYPNEFRMMEQFCRDCLPGVRRLADRQKARAAAELLQQHRQCLNPNPNHGQRDFHRDRGRGKNSEHDKKRELYLTVQPQTWRMMVSRSAPQGEGRPLPNWLLRLVRFLAVPLPNVNFLIVIFHSHTFLESVLCSKVSLPLTGKSGWHQRTCVSSASRRFTPIWASAVYWTQWRRWRGRYARWTTAMGSTTTFSTWSMARQLSTCSWYWMKNAAKNVLPFYPFQ